MVNIVKYLVILNDLEIFVIETPCINNWTIIYDNRFHSVVLSTHWREKTTNITNMHAEMRLLLSLFNEEKIFL